MTQRFRETNGRGRHEGREGSVGDGNIGDRVEAGGGSWRGDDADEQQAREHG